MKALVSHGKEDIRCDKDVQTYKRAHGQDVKRKSKREK